MAGARQSLALKLVNSDNSLPAKENCVYTKCYCEENIWKLCDRVKEVSPGQLGSLNVIFISNKDRKVPIWQQSAAREGSPYVVWVCRLAFETDFGIYYSQDYHVILLVEGGNHKYIYDMDTVLPYPCELKTYICDAIGSEEEIIPEYHRFFRVICAADYLQHFASDRSHMLKEDGSWMSSPPTYDAIKTKDCAHNLDDFISMESARGWGRIYSLPQFLNKFLTQEIQIPSLISTSS